MGDIWSHLNFSKVDDVWVVETLGELNLSFSLLKREETSSRMKTLVLNEIISGLSYYCLKANKQLYYLCVVCYFSKKKTNNSGIWKESAFLFLNKNFSYNKVFSGVTLAKKRETFSASDIISMLVYQSSNCCKPFQSIFHVWNLRLNSWRFLLKSILYD